MKLNLICFLVLLLTFQVWAVDTTQIEKVKNDTTRNIKAVYAGDVATVLSYTHPVVIQSMGGKEQAKKTLTGVLSIFEEKNMKLVSLGFPEPPIFIEGNENELVLIPTLSVISVSEQLVESLNYQFGVRPKNSADWKYVEGSRITKENVRYFAPDFPDGIEFPKFYRKKI
jgi:hypothetical protein